MTSHVDWILNTLPADVHLGFTSATNGWCTNNHKVRNVAISASIPGVDGSNKWAGGVLAGNGKIYGMPHDATSVLIIDPTADTNDTSTIAGLVGSSKWAGGVLAGNGKIYGIPYHGAEVLIVDPTTETADISTIVGMTGHSKWWGGVLAGNGKIYGIPFSADEVLIIDPTAETTDKVALNPVLDRTCRTNYMMGSRPSYHTLPSPPCLILRHPDYFWKAGNMIPIPDSDFELGGSAFLENSTGLSITQGFTPCLFCIHHWSYTGGTGNLFHGDGDYSEFMVFTTLGRRGQHGPAPGAESGYIGTNLEGMVEITATGTNVFPDFEGYQKWTVPATGTYAIQAAGAAGGGTTGGSGAVMRGDFSLTAGDVLVILVGQQSGDGIANGNNGDTTRDCLSGGGSFVSRLNGDPLLVAGGGSGSYSSNVGFGGLVGTPLQSGITNEEAYGGVAEGQLCEGDGLYYICNDIRCGLSRECSTNSGLFSCACQDASASFVDAGVNGQGSTSTGGGAGYYSDCDTHTCTVSPYSTTHPKSFLAGGVGGYYGGTASYGGFGGGAGGHSGGGMSGGGGYSGGGSDGNGGGIPQGSGGSYNAGVNQWGAAGTVRPPAALLPTPARAVIAASAAADSAADTRWLHCRTGTLLPQIPLIGARAE